MIHDVTDFVCALLWLARLFLDKDTDTEELFRQKYSAVWIIKKNTLWEPMETHINTFDATGMRDNLFYEVHNI